MTVREKPDEKKPVKKEEKLTDKDWQEIMGVNRDRYERKNRKIRRK